MVWNSSITRRLVLLARATGFSIQIGPAKSLIRTHHRYFSCTSPLDVITFTNPIYSRKSRLLQADLKMISQLLRHASSSSTTTNNTTGLADSILKSSFKTEKTGDQNSKHDSKDAEEEEERKKKENAARALKFSLYGLGGCFVFSTFYILFTWGAPLRDTLGNEIKDEFSHLPLPQQYFQRSWSELKNYKTTLAEPSREKLLPDPLKLPYIQPPYTLLLEVTGVLIHPEWTYRTGWRFKKRPGIDYFMKQISANHMFEVVIYTQESGFTAFPLVEALNSQQVVMYSLFRDSTRYVDGHHTKDLDRINRDLSKVIMVDCNPNAVKQHRKNAIVLPKWNGNDDDRALFDLASLLNTIAANEVTDVREVLEYYSKFPDPIEEFRKKQLEFAEREREREKMVLSLKQKSTSGGGGTPSFNFIPSFFRRS